MTGIPRPSLQALASAAWVALLVVAVPGAPPQARSPIEQSHVRIVLDVPAASHLPIYVAQNRGFFEDEGLHTDLAVLQSSSEALAVYLAGGADITDLGLTEILTARKAGRIIKIFWTVSDIIAYELWGRPNLHSLKDARGARFAVSKYGASSDFFTRYALKHAGLDPDRDVQILQVGGPGLRIAALVKGVVDVAILEPVEGLQARKAGMVVLDHVYRYLPNFPGQTLTFFPAWVDRHMETMRALIRAIRRADRYILANKTDSIELYKKIFRYDPDVAELAYNFYLPSYPHDGSLSKEGIRVAMDALRGEGRASRSYTFDELVDTRFIKEFANKP